MSETCGSGCSLYICPTSGETECIEHGGFDACCDHPRCPSRMTIDHPTREERYAAVIAAHGGEWTWRGGDDAKPIMCACGWQGCIVDHRAHIAAALAAADPAPAQPEHDHAPCCEACGGSGATAEGSCWDCRGTGHPHTPAQPDAGLSDESDGLGVIWACDNCANKVETSLDDTPAGWLIEEPDEDDYPEGEDVPDDLIVCAECRCPDAPLPLATAAVDPPALSDDEVDAIHAALPDDWDTTDALLEVVERILADRAAQPVPAPEVSRGVAEVKAEALREAADEFWSISSGWIRAALRDRADRIVRAALPTDDGADCCRERTTAGGCGCGGGS